MGRLVAALQALKQRKDEISQFYEHSVGYQVRRDGSISDTLLDIFRASVNERRGASFDRGKSAVDGFKEIAEELLELGNRHDGEHAAVAYQEIFERLCRIPQTDQKISAMYMKFVVCVFGIWPGFKPYLFVPLDVVVLKLLRRNLKWDDRLPGSAPTVKNGQRKLRGKDQLPLINYRRFLDIQDRLSVASDEAGTDRIFIDELWTIGQLFCLEYPLCQSCWIREACATRRAESTN